MREFRMPSLGADMEYGTLVEWNVKPGQKVKRGDVVSVVETQKGAVEVEIWDDGVVDQLVVETGTKVPVGDVLALLRGENEAPLAPYVARAAAAGGQRFRSRRQRQSKPVPRKALLAARRRWPSWGRSGPHCSGRRRRRGLACRR
jgi:pyruvate dehydrogenase E2 component (dihydrolipoamide acetyltransferase)